MQESPQSPGVYLWLKERWWTSAIQGCFVPKWKRVFPIPQAKGGRKEEKTKRGWGEGRKGGEGGRKKGRGGRQTQKAQVAASGKDMLTSRPSSAFSVPRIPPEAAVSLLPFLPPSSFFPSSSLSLFFFFRFCPSSSSFSPSPFVPRSQLLILCGSLW